MIVSEADRNRCLCAGEQRMAHPSNGAAGAVAGGGGGGDGTYASPFQSLPNSHPQSQSQSHLQSQSVSSAVGAPNMSPRLIGDWLNRRVQTPNAWNRFWTEPPASGYVRLNQCMNEWWWITGSDHRAVRLCADDRFDLMCCDLL